MVTPGWCSSTRCCCVRRCAPPKGVRHAWCTHLHVLWVVEGPAHLRALGLVGVGCLELQPGWSRPPRSCWTFERSSSPLLSYAFVPSELPAWGARLPTEVTDVLRDPGS